MNAQPEGRATGAGGVGRRCEVGEFGEFGHSQNSSRTNRAMGRRGLCHLGRIRLWGAVGNFADRFAWGERVCYLS